MSYASLNVYLISKIVFQLKILTKRRRFFESVMIANHIFVIELRKSFSFFQKLIMVVAAELNSFQGTTVILKWNLLIIIEIVYLTYHHTYATYAKFH